MATLGEIKTEVIQRTNRDDLLDDLADALTLCITRAIEDYAAERFWFNEARTASTTVTVGNEYVDLPTDLLKPDYVWLVVGNVRFPLTKRETWDIEELYSSPQSGQPTDYAMYQDTIRLWPTPTTAWQLIWQYVAQQPALTSDSSENAWTIYAADLVAAKACYLLYRDYFRDGDGAAAAKIAEAEAYARIKSESNVRIGTGRLRYRW